MPGRLATLVSWVMTSCSMASMAWALPRKTAGTRMAPAIGASQTSAPRRSKASRPTYPSGAPQALPSGKPISRNGGC